MSGFRGELLEMMRRYVRIVFLGIGFVFFYNFFVFVLRAVGNSLVPLVFLGLAAAANVALDLFLCWFWREDWRARPGPR